MTRNILLLLLYLDRSHSCILIVCFILIFILLLCIYIYIYIDTSRYLLKSKFCYCFIKLSSFLDSTKSQRARCFAPKPVFCFAQRRLDESGQVYSDQPRLFFEQLRCEASAYSPAFQTVCVMNCSQKRVVDYRLVKVSQFQCSLYQQMYLLLQLYIVHNSRILKNMDRKL